MNRREQKQTINIGTVPIDVWVLNPNAHSGLHTLTTIACRQETGRLYLGVARDPDDTEPQGTVWREVGDCWSAVRQFIHMRWDVEARARRFERARDRVRQHRKQLLDKQQLSPSECAAITDLLQELVASCNGHQVHWITDLIRKMREPNTLLDRELFSIDGLHNVIRKLDQEATRQYGIAASVRSDQATLQALIDAEVRRLDDMYFEFSSLAKGTSRPGFFAYLTLPLTVPLLVNRTTATLLGLRMNPHCSAKSKELYRSIVEFGKRCDRKSPDTIREELHLITQLLQRKVYRSMLEAELTKVTEFVYAEEEGNRSTFAVLLEILQEVLEVFEHASRPEDVENVRTLRSASEALAAILDDDTQPITSGRLEKFRDDLKSAVRLL